MSIPLRSYYLFVPDELVVLVDHNGEDDINLDSAQGLVDSIFAEYEPQLVQQHPLLTFQRFQPEESNTAYFSFIFVKLGNVADLLSVVYQLYDSPPDLPEPFMLRTVAPNWLMSGAPPTPEPPDSGGGGGPGTRPVAAASPYMEYTDLLDPKAPWNFHIDSVPDSSPVYDAYCKLKLALEDRYSNRAPVSDEVTVVILDTTPPAQISPDEVSSLETRIDQISSTPATLTASDKAGAMLMSLEQALQVWPNHALLQSLLQNFNTTLAAGASSATQAISDVLTIHYYEPYDALPVQYPNEGVEKYLRKTEPFEYPHFAMDHGLFIAGLVHTLAPRAGLHLIQVMNPYAYFSFHALAVGFNTIRSLLRAKKGSRLIVNMSLMYNFPSDPGKLGEMVETFESSGRNDLVDLVVRLLDNDFMDAMVEPGKELCALYSQFDQEAKQEVAIGRARVVQHGGILVAAAGNDGGGGGHPQARYPAAFDNVLGVAALGSDMQYASYSNLPDRPPVAGAAVFGGDAQGSATPDANWASPDTGMLGVYIGAFPNPDNLTNADFYDVVGNIYGWARWSGTSFATPVIAGLLAQLLLSGQAGTISEARDIIQTAFPPPVAGQPRVNLKQGV